MGKSNTQEEISFSEGDLGLPYTVASYEDKKVASKLLTMGLLPGSPIRLIRKSLFGHTFYVQSEHNFFALRKEEAATILVIKTIALEKSA